MRLYAIHNGNLPLPKALLVNYGNAYDNKRVMSDEAYREELLASSIQSPMSSYLIETEDGVVLFDFGNSLYSPIKAKPEQSLLYSLDKLGYRPDDIRYAVCSHLHADHVGYLKYFTESEIIVHSDELAAVRHLYETKRYDEDPLYEKGDIEDWFAADLDWMEVSGRFKQKELVPGVTLLVLGRGHSYGMLGLLVHLKRGNIILCSDCCYCRRNYEPDVVPQGALLDEQAYRETVEYLKEIAKENNAEIWCGHDAEQFSTIRKYDEGFYE